MVQTQTEGQPGFSALVQAYRDPHHLFDALRERDGISFDPSSQCWLVTGYAPVRRILDDPRFSSDLRHLGLGGPSRARRSFLDAAIERQIVFVDGEKQRGVHRAILRESARKAQEILPAVRAIADRLAARAKERGEIDLVQDFAVPFALEAVCLVMGVPVDDPSELAALERWSTTYVDITSGYLRGDVDDIVRLGDYFRRLVTARRAAPSADLLGVLLREDVWDDEEELVVNCMMVFAAGRATAQKLLGNGIPLLLPAWGEWREAHGGSPAFSRRLTEELLRVVTPTRYVVRHATEDADLSGELPDGPVVSRGAKVVLFLEAANRDPGMFAEAHRMRPERHPNPHAAFGFGPHRCPGASLGRLEVQTALEALLEAFAELRPDPSQDPAWHPNPNTGGYTRYPCLCA